MESCAEFIPRIAFSLAHITGRARSPRLREKLQALGRESLGNGDEDHGGDLEASARAEIQRRLWTLCQTKLEIDPIARKPTSKNARTTASKRSYMEQGAPGSSSQEVRGEHEPHDRPVDDPADILLSSLMMNVDGDEPVFSSLEYHREIDPGKGSLSASQEPMLTRHSQIDLLPLSSMPQAPEEEDECGNDEPLSSGTSQTIDVHTQTSSLLSIPKRGPPGPSQARTECAYGTNVVTQCYDEEWEDLWEDDEGNIYISESQATASSQLDWNCRQRDYAEEMEL